MSSRPTSGSNSISGSANARPWPAGLARLTKPSLYWLLIFLPVTLTLEHGDVAPPLLFFSAALAIVPIASAIVHATEQLATRTGDAVGGLLNATFGNAPELIIALTALRAGYLDMVRASLIGAILANLLLALGVAFLRDEGERYDPAAARLSLEIAADLFHRCL